MKKFLCAVILLAATLSAMAQDKQSLEQGANEMVELMVLGDYDKLMDYTYPKVFTITSREQLSTFFKDALQGDGFTIKVMASEPNFKFGEIKKIDKSYYSIIDHDLVMEMVFDEPIADEDLPRTLYAFKEGLETKNVTYDKPTKTLTIKKRSQMLAIADAHTQNKWTYINNDGGPLIKKLLPKKHLSALGLNK